MTESNLFWFGLILELGLLFLIVYPNKQASQKGSISGSVNLNEQLRNQELSKQLESERLRNQELSKQLESEQLRNQELSKQLESEQLRNQELSKQLESEQLGNQELSDRTYQLQNECLRLQQELQQQELQLLIEHQYATFEQLQTLLTNYPSLKQMVQAKPELSAQNLIALFTPLENMLQRWQYESIGTVWEQVAYDPQLHQPDVSDIEPGEPVYIRFVGYRKSDEILCPAKVSRTLPGGIA